MWKNIPDPANNSFNFQAWARMAKEEPALFEEKRRAVIEAFIARTPERNRARLQGLQWKIDMERRRASNPLAACVRIYEAIWESFAGEKGLIKALQGLALALAPRADKAANKNMVPLSRTRGNKP